MKRFRSEPKQLLAHERGFVIKSWTTPNRVLLIFPNSYRVGMSNLGFQLVYRLINSVPDYLCERLFYEPSWTAQGKEIGSFETGAKARDFDMLAFSLSYENDYPNVLTLLQSSHFPILVKDRDDSVPLVIAGGIAVTANPEPIAPFCDLVVLGDAEAVLPEFLELFSALKAQGLERSQIVAELASLPGVYDPQAVTPVYDEHGLLVAYKGKVGKRPMMAKDLARFPAIGPLVTDSTIFSGFSLVDVCRGCPRACRFCLACAVNRPFRCRAEADLLQQISAEVPPGSTVGLVGAGLSDFKGLGRLCRALLERGYQPSLSSLRADIVEPELLAVLPEMARQTLTLAPEAGSERMRALLGKVLPEDRILETASVLQACGVHTLKLYFMIGLPRSDNDEIDSIVELVDKVGRELRSFRVGSQFKPRLVVSVSSFVPKPRTVFQWESMADVKRLKAGIAALTKRLHRRHGVMIVSDSVKQAHIEALLARGDRRVANVLLQQAYTAGNWNQALRDSNMRPEFYTTRARTLGEIMPWQHLMSSEEVERLRSNAERFRGA